MLSSIIYYNLAREEEEIYLSVSKYLLYRKFSYYAVIRSQNPGDPASIAFAEWKSTWVNGTDLKVNDNASGVNKIYRHQPKLQLKSKF